MLYKYNYKYNTNLITYALYYKYYNINIENIEKSLTSTPLKNYLIFQTKNSLDSVLIEIYPKKDICTI